MNASQVMSSQSSAGDLPSSGGLWDTGGMVITNVVLQGDGSGLTGLTVEQIPGLGTTTYSYATNTTTTYVTNTTALTNGLVLYLPLDGDANDYSGQGNNGTDNSMAYAPGLVNTAAVYGTGYATVSPNLSTANGMTIAVWYRAGQDGSEKFFIDRDPSSAGGVIFGDDAGAGICFYTVVGNTLGAGNWSTAVPVRGTTNWHFLYMTITPTGNGQGIVTGCVDGVTTVITSGAIPSSVTSLLLGQDHSYQLVADGQIDELMIWNQVMSGSDMATVMALGQAGQSIMSGTGIITNTVTTYMTNSTIDLAARNFTAGAVTTTNLTVQGTISGNGSGLTGLTAAQIASGQLSPSVLPTGGGTWDAGGLVLTNVVLAGNGAGVTGLTAAQITGLGSAAFSNATDFAAANHRHDDLYLGLGGGTISNLTVTGQVILEYIPPQDDLDMGSFTNLPGM